MTLQDAHTLIGKRVLIKNAFPNSHPSDVGGELQYVGSNDALKWKLQVTVNRMPVQINSLDQIVEWKSKRIFKL